MAEPFGFLGPTDNLLGPANGHCPPVAGHPEPQRSQGPFSVTVVADETSGVRTVVVLDGAVRLHDHAGIRE